jgi:hypothetical protein
MAKPARVSGGAFQSVSLHLIMMNSDCVALRVWHAGADRLACPAASAGAAEASGSRAPRAAGARAVPARCFALVHRRVSALSVATMALGRCSRSTVFLTAADARARSGSNSNRSWRRIASARRPSRRSRCVLITMNSDCVALRVWHAGADRLACPAASAAAAEASGSRAPRAAGARAVPARCFALVHRRVSALSVQPVRTHVCHTHSHTQRFRWACTNVRLPQRSRYAVTRRPRPLIPNNRPRGSSRCAASRRVFACWGAWPALFRSAARL